jgi:hypothetical protein
MWKLFSSIADDHLPVVAIAELVKLLADKTGVMRTLERCSGLEGTKAGDEGHAEFNGISKVVMHLHGHLVDADTLGRLSGMTRAGEEHLSLRAMFCLVWPFVHENEIDACLRWCQSFRAREILEEIIEGTGEGKPPSKIAVGDLEVLFEVMDVNNDGEIDVDELCHKGHINVEIARRLVKRWDEDGSGTLNKSELRSIIYEFDPSVKNKLKGLYASTQMSPRPPQGHPTLLTVSRRRSDKRTTSVNKELTKP